MRFYYRTGRRSGVSFGPIVGLLILGAIGYVATNTAVLVVAGVILAPLLLLDLFRAPGKVRARREAERAAEVAAAERRRRDELMLRVLEREAARP